MPQMLLVVLGATGAQGGAVLRHFARNCKDFRLRGITRNPTSTKSKELSAIDVEMVKADLNDKASLALAFDEATHIFANIDSVEPIIESMQQSNLLKPGQTPFERGAELEKLQARNLIEASAASPTLERIIWSTLPGVSAKSGAKYTKVTHFDAKAEIAEMFMTHEVLKSKVSFLFVGLYFDMPLRVPELYPIWKNDEDIYELSLALHEDDRIPFANIELDTGGWVATLFASPPGTKLIGCSEMLSWRQWLQAWASRNRVHAQYVQCSAETHMARMGGAGGSTLQAMWFVTEYGMAGGDGEAHLPEHVGAPASSVAKAMAGVDWGSILG